MCISCALLQPRELSLELPPPLVRRDVLRRHVALVLGQAAIPTLEGVLELLERGNEGRVLLLSRR